MGFLRPHWIRTYLASGAILDVLVLPVLFRLLAADNYVAVAGSTGRSRMGIFAFTFNAMIFVGLILMTSWLCSIAFATWATLARFPNSVPRQPGSRA